MKKIVFILFACIFFLIITKEEYLVVPNDSIRLRVIPNSNSTEDIFIKEKVLESVINEINIKDSLVGTQESIENNISNINKIVKNTLSKYNYNKEFNVNFGINYFPKKIYKDVIYPEGEYESLVITLGSGDGSNFWCVLFPPLCMMETDESTEDIEYKFKIKEILNNFFE